MAESAALPQRSRLYSLAPRGVGTIEAECLTSYLNRLAWKYRVSPRVLIAQELVPQLTHRRLANPQLDRARSFN
ncbi:MAG: hypothetical protein ACREP9_03730 [Candidatus Dormibacteraceae bacterium]